MYGFTFFDVHRCGIAGFCTDAEGMYSILVSTRGSDAQVANVLSMTTLVQAFPPHLRGRGVP